MSQMDQPVGVGVAVVVRREDKVLLGLRTGSHSAGQWALPGGKPDAGEPPYQCAVRELREEAGGWPASRANEPQPLPLWTYDTWPVDRVHFVTLYFEARAPQGWEPKIMEPDKCLAWSWFDFRMPPDPLMTGTRKVLQTLKAGPVTRGEVLVKRERGFSY